MGKSCRSEFTSYLRNSRITYTTTPGIVSIRNFHFLFDDDLDTLTIRYSGLSYLSFSIPYASPSIILIKLGRFRQLLHLGYKQPCHLLFN